MVVDTCRRIIVIKAGEIVADGKTMDILTNVELLDTVVLKCLFHCRIVLSAAPKRSDLLRKAVFVKFVVKIQRQILTRKEQFCALVLILLLSSILGKDDSFLSICLLTPDFFRRIFNWNYYFVN